MGGDGIALAAIDTRAVRLMLDAVNSSEFERHDVFGALNRFMDWCVKRELITINPCSTASIVTIGRGQAVRAITRRRSQRSGAHGTQSKTRLIMSAR